MKSIYNIEDSYSFRTVFGNEIAVRVEKGMYVVEQEEERPVPERRYAQYVVQRLKPSQLLRELLYRDDLDPEEKYFIFKQLTFRHFTAPLLDPHIKNVNINDRTCIVTHDLGDLLYAAKYEPPDVDSVRFAFERELERTCTMTQPILEGSIELLDYVMRISITGRGLGIAPMTQISIRKHRKTFYTLVDQVRSNFLDPKVGTLLALNWALPVSMSQVVCGVMGTRKTSLLGCLIQFVEPNCILGILQDDPELDIRELPGVYVEWHCCRRATAGVREITLLDLLRAALRKNYRKIIIAEVRSPQEIYAYVQLLKVTYGAGTTIHALSVTTLEKRLLSAHWEGQTVDRTDLETIRIATICGFVDRKPRVLQIWYTDFVEGKHRLLAKYEHGTWLINEDVYEQYLHDIADLNNMTVQEMKQIYDAVHYMLETLSQIGTELTPRQLRELWLTYWMSGIEGVRECIRTLLQH